MFLRAEPSIQYGILPTLYAPVEENLWNAGLTVALFYSL
jgi:hypothetical protein